jgi:hypothetical protein
VTRACPTETPRVSNPQDPRVQPKRPACPTLTTGVSNAQPSRVPRSTPASPAFSSHESRVRGRGRGVAKGTLGTVNALKGTLGTLNLDPPMLLPWFLVSRRVGPGQARCAGGGRAAPAPTRRVACRERRSRDSCDVPRVPFETLNVLKGPLGTSGHVPKTPLTRRAPLARRALRTRPAKRASPAGPYGRADPGKIIGGFRLNVLMGTLETSPVFPGRCA